jgi:hypothetical protein
MVLSFYYIVAFIQKNQSISIKRGLLIAILLAFSVLAKPSFLFSFTPAIGLFLILFNWKNYRLIYKVLLLFLPSLALIFYQFLKTYLLTKSNNTADMKDEIVFTYFGVIKLYTPNVLISLILAISFPLSVLLLDFRNAIKDEFLVVSILNTFFGYLQAAFLAEKFKFDQAAFTFGYSLSLFLLFAFSLVFFLKWIDRQTIISMNVKIKTGLCVLLFSSHLISGFTYLLNNFYLRSF